MQEGKVIPYDPSHKEQVDKFREATFKEGNDSLIEEKFDPENLDGLTTLWYEDGKITSISVIERSHYTGDPDIAGRVCRHHVLKGYGNKNHATRFLAYQLPWAKEIGLKVIYYTHDVKNKSLNALYQKKRRFALGSKSNSEYLLANFSYRNFEVEKNMLFQVDGPESDFLQYIYSYKIDKDFVWNPPEHIVHIDESHPYYPEP